MNIKEIRKKKRQAESDITNILIKLQEETGAYVTRVDYPQYDITHAGSDQKTYVSGVFSITLEV
jgi:hypothetical protein